MSTVQDIDLFLDEYSLEESARKIIGEIRPQWREKQLTFKVFTDGITNKLIGCWSAEDIADLILVRIYGKNTDLLIDRDEEKANFILLHKAGYAPQLYATFRNGLAYAYVPGETVTTRTVRDVSVYPLIAVTMARIHSIHKDQPHNPILWDKIDKFLSLVPNQYSSTKTQETYKENFPDGAVSLGDELQLLKNLLSEEKSPIVFCHNDLLLPNIIYKSGKVSFIDYEYAGWNYQAFDIGNHFAEFAGVSEVDYSLYPDRDFQFTWIKIYLVEYNQCNNITKEINESDINKFYSQINKFALVSHLFWASWALVQAQHSTIKFNFMRYAITRMQEYYKKKNIFLKL
uniref:ethanolamine kinase n=3 Tax=Rhodnius TaxID=13248 RepID=T1IA39_RHOPR